MLDYRANAAIKLNLFQIQHTQRRLVLCCQDGCGRTEDLNKNWMAEYVTGYVLYLGLKHIAVLLIQLDRLSDAERHDLVPGVETPPDATTNRRRLLIFSDRIRLIMEAGTSGGRYR
jgi:hypothetical protein